MASYAEMKVSVTHKTAKALLCTFNEDEPEEQEVWVPKSVIEDTDAADQEDKDGNVTLLIEKWFLKENDIEYDTRTATDTMFKSLNGEDPDDD